MSAALCYLHHRPEEPDMAALRTDGEAPTGAGLQDPGPVAKLCKKKAPSLCRHSGQHWRVLKRLLVLFSQERNWSGASNQQQRLPHPQ